MILSRMGCCNFDRKIIVESKSDKFLRQNFSSFELRKLIKGDLGKQITLSTIINIQNKLIYRIKEVGQDEVS